MTYNVLSGTLNPTMEQLDFRVRHDGGNLALFAHLLLRRLNKTLVLQCLMYLQASAYLKHGK